MLSKKSQSVKRLSYMDWVIAIAAIILVNTLGNFYYARLDLTKEKRHTLSETSKDLADKLDETCIFKLYLAGELSSNFQQLQNEIRDKAYEFRNYSQGKLEIEIIDPLAGKDKKEVAKILEDFSRKGLKPVRDVETENADETRIKFLIPSAEFEYRGKTVITNFFDEDGNINIAEAINKSIKSIEYEFANGLRQCVVKKKKRIVVVDGSKETIGAQVGYFASELNKYYEVESVNLNINNPDAGRPFLDRLQRQPDSAAFILMNSLKRRIANAEMLLMVKPQEDYSLAEMYLIDQYMLNGGKVMWLLDAAHIEMDSFRNRSSVVAMDGNLENIKQSLFSYGIGLNSDLVQDINCNKIPIYNGQRMDKLNFMYFPLFTDHNEDHVITKNLGAVWGQFSGTIRPKARKGLSYTPLLMTTPRTRVVQAPATVEFITSFLQNKRPEYLTTMNEGRKFTAMLVEGTFKSPFINQKKFDEKNFKATGEAKMIVISDGDIMSNQVSQGKAFPTGYDRYNKITYANKKFLLNCIDYLIDDNGLIEIRAKDYSLRLLNQAKVKSEKSFWQALNVGLPILLIFLFGGINYLIRRRKYTR
ncbi:gliding motility-associated ABC transporter substrate-binding protein GldG [Bacteroidia bacterium]|nr:gliding motility-associated ABC transporter substrate-binding protein GldG [Bacteroidia bacterium]